MGSEKHILNIVSCMNLNFRVIDIDELMGVMVMLGNPRTEEEVKQMIAEEDTNNDGVDTKIIY